jgi:hypothetical protein
MASEYLDYNGTVTLFGQLMIRLHRGNVWLREGQLSRSGYNGIEIIDVRQYGDEVHIYVDTKKVAPFTMKDDANLFPSDGLITQFQVLAPEPPENIATDGITMYAKNQSGAVQSVNLPASQLINGTLLGSKIVKTTI